MLQAFEAVQWRRRLDRYRLQVPVQFLQTSSRTCERPCSSETCDKMGHPAIRLPPDLVCGRRVMSLPVRVIVVLIGIEVPVGIFLGKLARNSLRSVGSLKRICLNDLGTETSLDMFSRVARILRQGKRHVVATRRSDHRVSNSRVAAGRVENCLVERQLAASLAGEDHCKRRTVLYGTARIHIFSFRPNRYAVGKAFGNAAKPDQRRVSDGCLKKTLCDLVRTKCFRHSRFFYCRLHNLIQIERPRHLIVRGRGSCTLCVFFRSYSRHKCPTAGAVRAQGMQQQQVHLIGVKIDILESLLKSLYSEFNESRSGSQLIFFGMKC